MSTYRALYLPTDDPLVDGCKAITRDNEVMVFDEEEFSRTGLPFSYISRAELFLVDVQFNTPKMVGIISPEAKWVKSGDEILSKNVAEWVYNLGMERFVTAISGDMNDISLIKENKGYIRCWRIVCPMCGDLH